MLQTTNPREVFRTGRRKPKWEENPPPLKACRFDSDLGHHQNCSTCSSSCGRNACIDVSPALALPLPGNRSVWSSLPLTAAGGTRVGALSGPTYRGRAALLATHVAVRGRARVRVLARVGHGRRVTAGGCKNLSRLQRRACASLQTARWRPEPAYRKCLARCVAGSLACGARRFTDCMRAIPGIAATLPAGYRGCARAH